MSDDDDDDDDEEEEEDEEEDKEEEYILAPGRYPGAAPPTGRGGQAERTACPGPDTSGLWGHAPWVSAGHAS